MGLFDFFSKSKKKAPAPSKSYTDTSSLAGVERASRTKKPSLLSDLAMGFGLKEKDASYKIRTQQNIQRQREEAKKQAEKKRLEHDDRDVKRKNKAAATTGGGGTAAAPAPREMTEDEKYAEYMKRKLEERRKAGKVKRKEYEVAVGKKVAARRKKVQLLLM